MLSSFRKTGLENPFDAPILYAPEVGSTMDAAKELIARDRSQHGVVLWAGHQTAGRGRLADRRWEETPGGALLFTLLLENNVLAVAGSRALSLRLGLVVAETTDRYLPRSRVCRVKWPNDVLLSGRKVSGILVTRGNRWTQVGIGINLLDSSVPEALSDRAISVEEAVGSTDSGPPKRETLMLRLLDGLQRELTAGSAEGEPWHQRLSRRLAFQGERVRCDAPAFPVPVTGIVVGISPEGALLLSQIETETEPSRTIEFPEPWLCFDGEIAPL